MESILMDSTIEEDSTSNIKLIEVQHVGVTAKGRCPLQHFLPSTSFSNESEQSTMLFNARRSTYNKFSNTSPMETETESSKALYEMHSIQPPNRKGPSKIEFQLYRKPLKIKQHKRNKRKIQSHEPKDSSNILKRLLSSLSLMCNKKPQEKENPFSVPRRRSRNRVKHSSPLVNYEETIHKHTSTQTVGKEVHLGIYNFEHGCVNYLEATDSHPAVLSDALAARATQWATRFWAEVFGTLHIGVAFVVTFFLQSYRFVLYSLINTLLVGFLNMTSDYLVKPFLSAVFNGFLQPVLLLVLNIFSSLRELLAPIADSLNNFMQPLATLGRSLRLVDVNYATRTTEKEV